MTDTLVGWMAVPPAARYVDCKVPSVFRRIRDGKLKAFKVNGRCWLVSKDDLDSWILERRARVK
jgi:excisionase family DNA binding protein